MQKKNCTGLPLFLYDLKAPITGEIEAYLRPLGTLKFPLGGSIPVLKMDVPHKFVLSGLVGARQLKLLLKHSAPHGVRDEFEAALHSYLVDRPD